MIAFWTMAVLVSLAAGVLLAVMLARDGEWLSAGCVGLATILVTGFLLRRGDRSIDATHTHAEDPTPRVTAAETSVSIEGRSPLGRLSRSWRVIIGCALLLSALLVLLADEPSTAFWIAFLGGGFLLGAALNRQGVDRSDYQLWVAELRKSQQIVALLGALFGVLGVLFLAGVLEADDGRGTVAGLAFLIATAAACRVLWVINSEIKSAEHRETDDPKRGTVSAAGIAARARSERDHRHLNR